MSQLTAVWCISHISGQDEFDCERFQNINEFEKCCKVSHAIRGTLTDMNDMDSLSGNPGTNFESE